ncbi:MAG TPA: PQQ-binding-like beta-propeller repeat protein [Lacipirellulaceae bacterium]
MSTAGDLLWRQLITGGFPMMLKVCGGGSCWRRSLVVGLVATVVIGGAALARAQVSSGLISQQQARAIGLERQWFAQTQVDLAHPAAVRWILSNDQIVLLTGAGLIQLLDANTGQTMWTSDVGNPNYPSLGPAANDEFVALVNGSTLYLIDRHSGQLVNQFRLDGAPGAGPALGKEYVYVPLLTGRVEGYPLRDAKGPTWFYQSYGRTMVRPLVTPDSIVWGTDAGMLCVGRIHGSGAHFRVEAGASFDASQAYHAPMIYAVTRVGELLAVDERTGAVRWRYLTGFPTDRAPAAVGDRVYVASEQPELHCLDAMTGLAHWEAAGISQFAAVGKSHVYGIDQYGALTEVDAATGALTARIQSGETMTGLVNDQTDRLYLITGHGLVQCLHEIGTTEPLRYGAVPAAAETKEKPPAAPEYKGPSQPSEKPEAAPAAKPTPTPQQAHPESENPFGVAPPAAGDNSNPFGAAPATPATPPQKPAASPAAPADDNPFGS